MTIYSKRWRRHARYCFRQLSCFAASIACATLNQCYPLPLFIEACLRYPTGPLLRERSPRQRTTGAGKRTRPRRLSLCCHQIHPARRPNGACAFLKAAGVDSFVIPAVFGNRSLQIYGQLSSQFYPNNWLTICGSNHHAICGSNTQCLPPVADHATCVARDRQP